MKLDANRIARVKMRTSWFCDSSKAPKPSVSITMQLRGSPEGLWPCTGCDQIHRPLVQGFIVGPTPKPVD